MTDAVATARALLVDRPRVRSALREASAGHPLTLLTAPIGAGKSSALTLAFADDPAAVRLDLEPWHRGGFGPVLVETVRCARPDFGRATLGAIEAGAEPAAVAQRFAHDLRHVAGPLVVVIDNAQMIDDDAWATAFLAALVENAPALVRIVVAGRSGRHLASAEAVVRRQATVVDPALLRFDEHDVLALAARLGRGLTDAQAASLVKISDGWPAAIVLALAAPPAAGFVLDSFAGAAAFLEATLLPVLAPDDRAFLETIAVFETLELRVLAALPGVADAGAAIARLQRAGASIDALGERGRYRLHPILRDLARRRLAERGGLAQAHAAAADAYAAIDAPAAALHHVVASGEPAVVARFLRRSGGAAMATGDRRRMRAAAALLDPAGPDADIVAFVAGLDGKAAGDPAARAAFAGAAQAAERSGDARVAFLARAELVEYDLARLQPVDEDALGDLRVRATSLGAPAAATAAMLAGWAAAVAHDFPQALRRIAPQLDHGDIATRFDIGILHAYVCTALGRFDEAATALDALVQALENDDRIVLQTLALTWFARLALVWGKTDAAFDAAAHAERLARSLDFHAEEAALYTVLADLATQRGHARDALAYAERSRTRANSAWYAADVARTRAFALVVSARAAFLAGDGAAAWQLALRAVDADAPAAIRALASAEAAVYALLTEPFAAARMIADARRMVAAAVPVDVADAASLATAADLLLFLAAANGEAAPDVAPPAGPFAAFVAERRGVVSLEAVGVAVGTARARPGGVEAVTLALDGYERGGPRYEARLARAYAERFVRPAARAVRPTVAVDVTAREAEILRLLVDGLANKEIAQRLGVSPRTVETHVERILGKLEVGSRARAIAKALRLGLVVLDGDP